MKNWKEEELQSWLDKTEWKQGFDANPDISINKNLFAQQYFANQEYWDIAFEFLASADLNSIELGKYELLGEDVFAMVSEYNTKNVENARLEAHKKYADIQFMIAGEELMGVCALQNTVVTIHYDEAKDVCFLDSPDVEYHKADQSNFFVFLPSDAHRPCVKVEENIPIKKVVIKVRVK